jgi:RNA polymerase sigma-70 factor (ECF subfamily)
MVPCSAGCLGQSSRTAAGVPKGRGLASARLQPANVDRSLIRGISSGREEAIAELYDRYSSIVYSVALRVLGDTGRAEDVMQEVFMQLWRNPGAFDANRGSLAAWLAVIGRNRAIDALRKRRPESNIEDVVVAADVDLESEAARKIMVEKVRGVLAGMPAEQRRAIELAFFEGLTHTEVAAKLGEPLGTVKTRIRSALQALRKVMA